MAFRNLLITFAEYKRNSMAKIIVKEKVIKTLNKDGVDYICITDIARLKNTDDPNSVIGNWMRNRNTIEFLGIWESLYNQNFNGSVVNVRG